MPVEFVSPQWLLLGLLLLPWIYLGYRRSLSDFPRPQRLASLLVRSTLLLLILTALARPLYHYKTAQQFVLFLVDVSDSIGQQGRQAAHDYVRQALQAASPHKVAVAFFAGKLSRPYNQWPDQPPSLPTRSTNIERALTGGSAFIPPGYVPRIVLLTDGRETSGHAERAATLINAPVDVVPLPARNEPETQIAAVAVPSQVAPEEPFYVEVVVTSNRPGPATVALYRNGLKVAERQVDLPETGTQTLRFRDQVRDERQVQYVAVVRAEHDTVADDNILSAVTYSRGRPKVLVVEQEVSQGRHLARALRRHGMAVEVRTPQGLPDSVTALQEFDLVILSNVPATDLTLAQMESLKSYVEDFGGGFVMVGGDQAFGLGGYYRTVIEEILPVRCDIQRERDKPVVAMVLIIDKSGSMGGIKIEMAKEAARNAVELLGPRDLVGVIAFDGEYVWLAELQPAANRVLIMDSIAGLQAGGGTAMYPPMVAAYESLLTANAKIKHVILLTDGISAPGDFQGIASEMRAAGITVSTVGVGGDHDAALLEEIAQIGRGRYYRTDDPAILPQIFTKETAQATRSALNEEPSVVDLVLPSPVVQGIDFEAAPLLLGYVITRPKPTAEVALTVGPGHPLLAYWRYGLGMSVAFTSDVHRRWAAEWLQWTDFGAFWAQVARFAMRKEDSLGLSVRLEAADGKLRVSVDSVAGHGEFATDANTTLLVQRPDDSREELDLVQVAPGRYEGQLDLPTPGAYQLRLLQRFRDGSQKVLTRAFVQGYPEELRIGPPNEALLRRLAEITGGMVNPEPRDAFRDDGRRANRSVQLWPSLLAVALCLFVLDVALRRIEWARRKAVGESP